MLRTVADKDVRHARIFSGFLQRPLRRNCSSFPPRSESRIRRAPLGAQSAV